MGRCCPANSNALENTFMSQVTQDSPAPAGNASGADFTNFGLPEMMLVTLAREGLVEPTPIQALSIPPLLDGKDLIGLAQTGTGKTAAFLLPLMTQLGYSAAVRAGQPPKALILAPTRELANQISQNVQKLAADINIRHIAVFGGARYDAQIRGLRRGVDIVVATPGRLQDLMDRGAFDPSGITHFVLDEADHMLDLGFYPAIKRIAASLPARRQTMLFSATMPPEIEALGKQFLRNPERVKAPQTGITADKVTQRVTLMAESEKRDRLSDILRDETTGQALIFVRTKRRADALAKFLSVRGLSVDALHGDMRQTVRQKVLRNFRSGELRALIATDVAARGIDVAGLSHVVNFDLTDTPEAYVHRIGRTGRAGLGGLALSFCAPDEQHKLGAIISVVGGRVELFELDGTPITDFKAAPGAGKQRRQRARPAGRGGRPERSSGRAAGSDKRPPRQPKPFKERKRGADADAGERRQRTDRDATARHDKPQRPSKPARSGKPAAGKSAAPSGQKLFSKRPKFNSRPDFGDSPATPARSGSQSGKPDTPRQKHKHGSAGKSGRKAGGAQQRDSKGGAGNHADGRPKKPGQKPRFRGAAVDGQSQRGHAKPGSKSGSKSGPGGQGRLKRRP